MLITKSSLKQMRSVPTQRKHCLFNAVFAILYCVYNPQASNNGVLKTRFISIHDVQQ